MTDLGLQSNAFGVCACRDQCQDGAADWIGKGRPGVENADQVGVGDFGSAGFCATSFEKRVFPAGLSRGSNPALTTFAFAFETQMKPTAICRGWKKTL